MTLLLGASELEGLVDRAATVEAVARVFGEIATGAAHQPGPTSMVTPADSGRYILMSAVSDGLGLAGVKLLADLPGNAQRDLPTQRSMNVVGARPRPDEREVDSEAMRRSSVWVDDRATAEAKSGDLLLAVAEGALAPSDVIGTIGEVLAGLCRGRADADEITLFDSVGIGAQDRGISRGRYRGTAPRRGCRASPHSRRSR